MASLYWPSLRGFHFFYIFVLGFFFEESKKNADVVAFWVNVGVIFWKSERDGFFFLGKRGGLKHRIRRSHELGEAMILVWGGPASGVSAANFW